MLAPDGEAFVQLPVLDAGVVPRAWRAARTAVLPLARRGADRSAAFRGTRVTEQELARGLREAGLRVLARDTGPDAPYRFATDVFLRLGRG